MLSSSIHFGHQEVTQGEDIRGLMGGVNGWAGWLGDLKCKEWKIRDVEVWGRLMAGLGRGFWSGWTYENRYGT